MPQPPGQFVVTDGSTTVRPVNKLTLAGATVSDLGGGNAGIDVEGGGSVPLPFVGKAPILGWTRPALASFPIRLNPGGQAIMATGDDPGTGYLVGDTWTAAGGTVAVDSNFPAAATTQLTVTGIQAISATVVDAGTGGTPGAALVQTTTGDGEPAQFNVTIGGGGTITSIDSVADPGDLVANLTDPTNEPMADESSSGISGVVFNIVLGIAVVSITRCGRYSAPPSNPVAQGATSGSGTGATFDLTFSDAFTAAEGANGLPMYVYATADTVADNGSGPVGVLRTAPVSSPWSITVGSAAVPAGLDDPRFLPIILYNADDDTAVVAGWSLRQGWLTAGTYSPASAGMQNGAFTEAFHSYIPFDYFEFFGVYYDGSTVQFYTGSEGILYLQVGAPITPTGITHVGFGVDRSFGLDDGDQAMALTWAWVQGVSPPTTP